MNQKALNALEYPKIIEKLTEKASSGMGKHLCRTLEPSTDLEVIRTMQLQTRDALTRLFQKGSISFGNVKDIRGSLKRLEIGSSLGVLEILSAVFLRTPPVSKPILVGIVLTYRMILLTICLTDFLPLPHSLLKYADAFFLKMRSVTMQVRLFVRSEEI